MKQDENIDAQKYEEIFEMCVKKEKLSVELIVKEFLIDEETAKQLYEEVNYYHDELYLHNAMYEISFMDDIPTPSRIMNLLNISYVLAKKIFDYYMENQ